MGINIGDIYKQYIVILMPKNSKDYEKLGRWSKAKFTSVFPVRLCLTSKDYVSRLSFFSTHLFHFLWSFEFLHRFRKAPFKCFEFHTIQTVHCHFSVFSITLARPAFQNHHTIFITECMKEPGVCLIWDHVSQHMAECLGGSGWFWFQNNGSKPPKYTTQN